MNISEHQQRAVKTDPPYLRIQKNLLWYGGPEKERKKIFFSQIHGRSLFTEGEKQRAKKRRKKLLVELTEISL